MQRLPGAFDVDRVPAMWKDVCEKRDVELTFELLDELAFAGHELVEAGKGLDRAVN